MSCVMIFENLGKLILFQYCIVRIVRIMEFIKILKLSLVVDPMGTR